MLLAPDDATAFLKLYPAVIGFAAGRLGGAAGIVDLDTFRAASRDSKAEARDRLLDNITLIDAFIDENPSQFRETELGLVAKWRNFLRGRFVIERHLKDCTIFLDWQEEPKAYAVVGLTTEFDEMLSQAPPVLVEAVLLPWKDRIVCDGLIRPHRLMFGSGYKRSIRDSYRQAKAGGIITSIDPDWRPTVAPPSKPSPIVRPNSTKARSYTAKQGQILAFIHYYTKVNGLPPAEADVARYFGVTAPAAHGAILTLQRRGLIERTAGQSRSIRLLLPREQLPDLE